ncbi:hypothetical protein [Bacteroides sp.]|uniref:outer membrane protein n=1 Tax=Bacteroides sp. TaxID=29523 RepID=UPI002625D2CE|nr:hypothetical protein [Bacteroides sp.]
MKKLLLLLTLFACISLPCLAQNYTEVVYLKNGSIIRGIIIEQVPNASLKIQTSDGSVFSYTLEEVEKITKEGYYKQPKQAKESKEMYRKQPRYVQERPVRQARSPRTPRSSSTNSFGKASLRGYKGFVETGYIFDLTDNNANCVDVSTIHGFQFNDYLFVGGGAAFNYYTDADAYSAPVFASFRANFRNKRIAPFADTKLGYSVGDVEGAYATAGIGVRFALARKMALNLKLEYVYQDYGYTSYGYDYSESLNSVGIKLGFEF